MTMTRRRLLDDIFKKSVVGNPAIATDSLARMYPGITMQGWTTQDGTPTPETPVPIVSAGTQNQETGKWEYEVEVGCGQLLNFQEKNVIQNGISYESKIDTITINGNKTNGDGGRVIYKTNYFVLQPGTYTFSYEVVNDINSTISGIFLTEKGSNKILGRTFTLNKSTEVYIGTNIYGARQANDVVVRCMLNTGSTALPYTPYRPPQTVTLTADRPLTKWDRLEKRNGQWGWVYKSEEIESYTDEIVPGEYYSTTGQLSVGAQVWYETTTETFAPLSESEQEAMNALHTYRPTTVLSNQQDCDMTLTYKTRKGMS